MVAMTSTIFTTNFQSFLLLEMFLFLCISGEGAEAEAGTVKTVHHEKLKEQLEDEDLSEEVKQQLLKQKLTYQDFIRHQTAQEVAHLTSDDKAEYAANAVVKKKLKGDLAAVAKALNVHEKVHESVGTNKGSTSLEIASTKARNSRTPHLPPHPKELEKAGKHTTVQKVLVEGDKGTSSPAPKKPVENKDPLTKLLGFDA